MVVVKVSARGLQRLLTAGSLYGFSFEEPGEKPQREQSGGELQVKKMPSRDCFVFLVVRKSHWTLVLYPIASSAISCPAAAHAFTLGLEKGE